MGGPFARRRKSKARLDGKTVVITGANTGIGKETALDLARRGACVVMACRDERRAQAAAAELRDRLSGCEGAGQLRVAALDLASLASVRACAQQLLEQHPRIHLLINNAGIMGCPRSLTEDGFEKQLGVNHLGHFLLTCLLLPRLRASAPARVVTVSSVLHKSGSINFDDLLMEKSYAPLSAYERSKLANVLFSMELGKRLEGTGVTTYSLHPGLIATEIARNLDESYCSGYTRLFNAAGRVFFKSPEQGAQTTIYCAVEERLENETGHYYSGCRKATPGKRARDVEASRRLWEESLLLTGLGGWDPCSDHDGSQPLSGAAAS